jgi:Family of unknown function (DUF6174)
MRALRTLSRAVFGIPVVFLVALVAAGCDTTGPTDDLDRERERLEQARAQWRSQGIVDYRYTFRRSCFCGPDVREPAQVVVRGGQIVSVQSVASGAPLDPALYYTVEGLFDLLEDAIDQEAARLSATYDSGLGYPTSGYIDRNEMIADEELGFQSSDLERMR